MIEIRGVSHAYATTSGPLPVLDDLSLSVPRGGFAAVVGPSGCGKSTLTRLISGLMIPDAGEVRLQGARVTGPRATVGMAFQNPVLLEWRSILKNVLLPLEIVPTRLSRAQAEERARKLLHLVGLDGFEDARPSELSGGMRQRASLCRALIHQPEVLVLDEPFGALDAFTREDLWQIMHRVKLEEPFTGVLITHDLRESIFLADRVFVLSGRPARTQYVLKVPNPNDRTIEDLYTPHSAEMLATLRRQIEIAQGRSAPDPAPDAGPNADARVTAAVRPAGRGGPGSGIAPHEGDDAAADAPPPPAGAATRTAASTGASTAASTATHTPARTEDDPGPTPDAMPVAPPGARPDPRP